MKLELENLRKERLHGFFVRSRANWNDNGEKVTEYFCDLGKQHIASKTIHYIETENGNHVYDQNEILTETKNIMKPRSLNQMKELT